MDIKKKGMKITRRKRKEKPGIQNSTPIHVAVLLLLLLLLTMMMNLS